jgi:hypothetical protein
MLNAVKERVMKLFKNPLVKSLLATAVLTAACASAWAEDRAARAPVPTVNYSGVSGIGEYVAEQASDEQYALFQRDKGLTILVVSHAHGKDGSRECVAEVGITHAPVGDKAMPRMPSIRFFGGASDPSFSNAACKSKAVLRALDALLGNEAKALQATLDATLPSGEKRPVEKASSTMTHSIYLGMTDVGNRYIRDEVPAWFARAFDYRAVVIVERYTTVEADNGDLVCFASIGLTARSPSDRQVKEPFAEVVNAGTLKKSERANVNTDGRCFYPFFHWLVKENLQPDSDLIKTFIDNWARVAEPGLKAPTMKDVRAAAAWQAERDRKAAEAERAQEARQQRVAQQNSCTVNCVNGACIRQWPNGRSERFQAPRKFNPFTSQWEWDTSGC